MFPFNILSLAKLNHALPKFRSRKHQPAQNPPADVVHSPRGHSSLGNWSAGSTASFDQQQQSRLMGLPAELRNKIFELALLDQESINVSASGYERPGLLTTCKQIAHETTGMLYSGRTFHFHIQEFDTKPLHAFLRTTMSEARFPHLNSIHISITSSLSPDWFNLLQWLEGCHNGSFQHAAVDVDEIRTLRRRDQLTGAIIAGMFCAAQGLCGKTPWQTVEDIVSKQRASLIAIDGRWARDCTASPLNCLHRKCYATLLGARSARTAH